MKKGKKTVACAMAAAITLSAFSGLVGMPKLGPLGADVVSAATGETTAPAKSTPAKPSTSTKKSSTKTTTTAQTTTNVSRLLKLGSKGSDVKTLQTLLNNNGYNLKVDGVFGKKTLAAVKGFQKENGLAVDGIVGPKTLEVLKPAVVAAVEKVNLKFGRAEYAAHGTKCFTVAVVAMAGDKIVGASIDDYQFIGIDLVQGVPNSDKDFGKNFKDPSTVLASKRTNTAYYSEHMKEEAGSTVAIDKNFDYIQAFATGKTIAELEAAIKVNPKDPKIDSVSGATAVDTNGYLSAILAAAKSAKENSSVQVETSELKNLKLSRAEYAAHGTKCFTVAVTATIGDKIVGASIDDYQFISKDLVQGVPNSDKDFGKNFKDPTIVLASKRTNTSYYSEHMKEEAGSTVAIDKNFDYIQAFAAGKTIAELEAAIKVNPKDPKIDAVSGATAVDTNGYLSAILAAAKGTTQSTAKVESKIAKIGLGHITSIGSSKNLVKGSGATGQVDTTLVAAGFDKDGKVVAVTLDNAQTKVLFNDDLTLKSDPKSEVKTKVELKEGYGMIKASAIKKEWYQQAEALGQWMIGKTVDQILGMKVVAKDEHHPAVPAEPDVVSSVSITVDEFQKAVKEAYDNAVAVKPGAMKLGLGHDVSIGSSKGLSAAADGTQVLPLAQVDATITVAAFDKDGKLSGAIIDNAQTKINFDKDGKVTSDKTAEVKTKNELKEAYGMAKASSIKKEWYQQAKAFADWIVGKTAEQVLGMKVTAKDEHHPAVPAEPDVVTSVTISVDGFQKALSEASQNAK